MREAFLPRPSLARDAGLLAVSQYAGAGLGLLTTVVAARLLGPTDYGRATLVLAYPMLLWSFFAVKSISVTTRYIAGFIATGEHEKIHGVSLLGYRLDLLSASLALVIVCLTGWWAARVILRIADLTWLMIGYAATLPFSALEGTSWAILSSGRRFKELASFQVLEPGLILILTLGLLAAGLGVVGVVAAVGLGQAAIGIASIAVARRVLGAGAAFDWRHAVRADLTSLRGELYRFYGWNYAMVTLSGLVAHAPVLLLGRFHGADAAGFYRLAASLMTVGSYLEGSLVRVSYPVLSAKWISRERSEIRSVVSSWTLRAGMPIALAALLSVPILPYVIPVVFGQAYHLMIPGAQLMVATLAASGLFFWLHPYYYASGRVDVWTKAYAAYAAVVVGLAWVCVQRWGFIGMAALATATKILFVSFMLTLFVRFEKASP